MRMLLRTCLVLLACAATTESAKAEQSHQIEFLGLFQRSAAVLHCSQPPCRSVDVAYWWIFENSDQSRIHHDQVSSTQRVFLLDLSRTWTSNVSQFCFQLSNGKHRCYHVQSTSTGIAAPRHVTAVSSNVNHTISWQAPEIADDYRFEVECMDLTFDWREWEPVDDCHPTEGTSCRVYEPIHDRHDTECPDYSNIGKFNFRVRSCLAYRSGLCSEWVETAAPLQLPGTILPPAFHIVGVYSDTQLRIMNKPYLMAPSNKSLNCFYDEKLQYMIRYWSPNDTSQPTRERLASFDMTLITLKLFEKPMQNAYMCVKMRVTEDVSYKSDWREVCKTVQVPTEGDLDGDGQPDDKFIVIFGVTLTIGALLLGAAAYKLKRAYQHFFRRDMKLPDKLAEILRDFEKAFDETSNPGTSRLDELVDQSVESECVETFLPVVGGAPPFEATTDFDEDGDSVLAIASLFSDGRMSPSIPIVSSTEPGSDSEFMYIRNAASADSSHYAAQETASSIADCATKTYSVDVHESDDFRACVEDQPLEVTETAPCCSRDPCGGTTNGPEYTTVEQELSRSLQMRACRNGVLETCLENRVVSNLHATPASSLDDVFFDEPPSVAGRSRVQLQYEMENPTYSAEAQSPHDVVPGFDGKFLPPLNRSSSVESAETHAQELAQRVFGASSVRKNRNRPKRSSLYQRRITRRKRLHSYGYIGAFGVQAERSQPQRALGQQGVQRDLEVHICHGRSQCCPRCCTRSEQVRSRSDSCRSADSGYPLDWSSFSDESPPPSPLDLVRLDHTKRFWFPRRWRANSAATASSFRPDDEQGSTRAEFQSTKLGPLSITKSPELSTPNMTSEEPCVDVKECGLLETDPPTKNTFFRPSSKRDYATSSYLELSALPKMFPKVNTNI